MTPYDRVVYESLPYLEAHPDRMRLCGLLLGLAPTPVERARVLELGCGAGGNLLPMAEMFPGARFVGVDTARTQIDEGAALARELGLANIELQAGDLAAASGEFDYVIAHGVYSWVAPAVRERLLDTIAARLAPRGIAYLDHNVRPGWNLFGLARDMMLHHVRDLAADADRLAGGRALLGFLADGARDPRWRSILEEQNETLARLPDGLAFHDYLGDETGACWFHELAANLAPRGLAWLCDADCATWQPVGFATGALAALDRISRDAVDREQYLDFLTMRGFRMSLLCRAGEAPDRALGPERLRALHVGCGATRGDQPGSFHTPRGLEVHLDDPATLAALDALVEAWPASRPVASLGAVEAELLQLFLGGVVELSPRAPAFTGTAGERPLASPLARSQAARGQLVTNRRHESVKLDEPHARLLALCDGTRVLAADEHELLERLTYGALLIR